MIENSSIQLPWYSFGKIVSDGRHWLIEDLLVRWGETDTYNYISHRINLEIPVEVQPGQEAVEYYLEQAKDAIIAQAQALLAQEEGFA